MLMVKFVNLAWFSELAHLQLRYGETVFVNCIDDLSSLNVTVWLNERESSPGMRLKFVSSEDVGVVHQLELSGMYVDNRAEE